MNNLRIGYLEAREGKGDMTKKKKKKKKKLVKRLVKSCSLWPRLEVEEVSPEET